MTGHDDRTDPSRFWSLLDELVAASEIVEGFGDQASS
jgi:hypothetical protein